MRSHWVPFLAVTLLACGAHSETPADEDGKRTQQQIIVDRAAAAVSHLRAQERFRSMGPLLERARAVLVFPKLIKASFVFGGEGGNGVLLARTSDGGWSSPAFYTLGAPSVGLQAGFRQSTAVLFVMNDLTLETLLHSSMTLGAQTSATLGHVGERGLTEGEVLNKDIYVLIESGGAFAGFSLDGYVIQSRKDHNELYYGVVAGPREIAVEGKHSHPGAAELRAALDPKARAAGESEAVVAPADYHACSPESRLAASCKPEQVRVCGEQNPRADCSTCKTEPVHATFENACEACRDPSVQGYRPGACTGAPSD
jgi:lipid-binding SYLF domain-containing protein